MQWKGSSDMRMMIIGDADDLWLKSLIERTIDLRANQLLLISHSNIKYQAWYEEQGISVVLIPKNNLGKLNTFISAYQLKKQLKNECFDAMLIHFVDCGSMIIGLYLIPLAREHIASFMGSDVFRAKKSTVLFFRYALKKFERINITTDAMLERFRKDYGNYIPSKITRARFGLNGLRYLRHNMNSYSQGCDFPEIPRDKIVVAVGYNGHPMQQHLLVIDELKKISKEKLRCVHLVFRMTYGCKTEYLKQIKAELERISCTYSIYTEFLSDEKSALLTCLTDMFIHAQVTDAFSASMLEHLYAGVQVFNPTWIPYLELQDPSVHYIKYGSFEELRLLVQENLMKKEVYSKPDQLEQMRRYIEKLADWDHLKLAWQTVYCSDC